MEDRDGRSILVGDADRNSTQTIAALQQSLGLIVTAVQTGAEVLAQVDRACPELVLLAADLPDPSAYEVLRQLRERFGDRLPIVVLSACHGEPRDEIASLLLGADDYFNKPLEGDRFIARVRRLLRRSNTSTTPAQPMTGARMNHLTARELQVLRLLVDGLRSAEIAQKLCITRKTVSTHIEHILAKLDAHSQAQAVAFALRNGLFQGPAIDAEAAPDVSFESAPLRAPGLGASVAPGGSSAG